MTEKLSGCDSYRICSRCGNYVYFSQQNSSELDRARKVLEKNYESIGDTSRQTDEKTIICQKCGEIISLC